MSKGKNDIDTKGSDYSEVDSVDSKKEHKNSAENSKEIQNSKVNADNASVFKNKDESIEGDDGQKANNKQNVISVLKTEDKSISENYNFLGNNQADVSERQGEHKSAAKNYEKSDNNQDAISVLKVQRKSMTENNIISDSNQVGTSELKQGHENATKNYGKVEKSGNNKDDTSVHEEGHTNTAENDSKVQKSGNNQTDVKDSENIENEGNNANNSEVGISAVKMGRKNATKIDSNEEASPSNENDTEFDFEDFDEDDFDSEDDQESNTDTVSEDTSEKGRETNRQKKRFNEYKNEPRPCSSCDFSESTISLTRTTFFGLFKKKIRLEAIRELWLISVPRKNDTWENLNEKTSKHRLSQNYKFHMPILKVGTLNVLMSLLEQLSTLDKYSRDTICELVDYMREELKDKPSMLQENLTVKGLSPAVYMTRFNWNKAKYPTWHSIPLIADIIFTHVDKISKSLRQKTTVFNNIKSSLKNFESRETDNLHYRYLGDIVKKEHFVLDSKYFETLLVVVPNDKIKKWLTSYESLCDMILPNSSQKIFQDRTHALFTVTLAKKSEDVFKQKAKDGMFLVRDFKYSEDNLLSEKSYYENLSRFKARQLAAIFRWVKVQFGECFEAWLHVKALRVFVESVLRYGLPVNYEAVMMIPLKSKSKLKNVLDTLFADADSHLSAGEIEDIPGALTVYGVEEYYPYVYFEINLDFFLK